MATKPRRKKRIYLGKDERHAALLDNAAIVVETHGWPALSMISVAEHAKVTRQLVYDHFTSVDELMKETMAHIFRDSYERIREHIGSDYGSIADLATTAEKMTFDLSPGRIRALWQMITATHSTSNEVNRTSRRVRHLLTDLWTPVMIEKFGVKPSDAKGVAWMLLMSFWGAHQMVDEGELAPDDATRLFGWMITKIHASTGVKPARVRNTKKSAAR